MSDQYGQRTAGGGRTHWTGKDGDKYYALCGRNLPGGLKSWEEKTPQPDYAMCERCMKAYSKLTERQSG